ncbi:MAG TPA: hypothetical protein PK971_13010, partial [Saprospiraceae bacterium]|nr:hypothetical protein [Saprospiraceae bacterium]HND89247.1 hypothetical protein [Saprospiraceae bacterium]
STTQNSTNYLYRTLSFYDHQNLSTMLTFLPSAHRSALCAALSLLLLAACRKEYITNEYVSNNIIHPDYCILEGKWLRISSNYSEYDGMVVEVDAKETQGIITTAPTKPDPQGVQVVGKVKWANLQRESGDIFTMDDLNNDLFGAGRRSAVIAAISPDTLRIATRSNGSWQLWVRQ